MQKTKFPILLNIINRIYVGLLIKICDAHMQLILPWPSICMGEQNSLSKSNKKQDKRSLLRKNIIPLMFKNDAIDAQRAFDLYEKHG